MALTTPHRKLLWGRSAGCCAICKCAVTDDATDSHDPEIVIGEEAHIVSSRHDGPRYRRMEPGDVDHYNNLILLCPNDHARVDKQVGQYSESRLREIKAEHEKWAKDRRQAEKPVRLRDVRPGKAIPLRIAKTGAALMAVFGGSHAFHYSKPDELSDEDVDLLGDFLQDLTDWMDLWSGLGPGEQLRAERDVGRHLEALHEAGFLVYVGVRPQMLEGGVGLPSRWQTAVVVVRRAEEPTATDDGSPRWAVFAP